MNFAGVAKQYNVMGKSQRVGYKTISMNRYYCPSVKQYLNIKRNINGIVIIL